MSTLAVFQLYCCIGRSYYSFTRKEIWL